MRFVFVMRRVIAAFLLACLGMMIPLAAAPVRVCLIENELKAAGEKACCSKCKKETKHDSHCCVQVDELPDAPPIGAPEGVPPLMAVDLPPQPFLLPPVAIVPMESYAAATPIRGPDEPCRQRAILGVWRL
jgi:hypothetical protein